MSTCWKGLDRPFERGTPAVAAVHRGISRKHGSRLGGLAYLRITGSRKIPVDFRVDERRVGGVYLARKLVLVARRFTLVRPPTLPTEGKRRAFY